MVRFLKVALVGLASLVLAGCFTSTTLLLDADAAVTPLSAGDYANDKGKRNVTVGADGWYDQRVYLSSGALDNASRRMLLNRAPELESGSRSVYYFAAVDQDVNWVYGLLVIEGGAVYDIVPDCEFDDAAHDIATSEGAKYYEDEYSADCGFSDAASLKRALGRYYRGATLPAAYYRQ